MDKPIEKLRAEALRQFHVAFGLMTIIPLFICVYLVTVKFFSIEILVGINGAYILLGIAIALLGLLYGRGVIRKVVQRLVEAGAELDKLLREQATLIEALKSEISDKELAQERLKETQDQLVRAAKMQSVGQLAAGTAHEVKNPLATLMMGLDFLENSIKEPHKEIQGMFVDMRAAIRKADGIVRGLLDYASSADLKVQPEDLNAVIEDALLLLKNELDKYEIRVRRDFQEKLPPALVDRNRMQQVFINLITNGIHAMPPGGELVLRTSIITLDRVGGVVGRRSADHFAVGEPAALVQIEDAGRGIDKDIMDRIFDPFFTTRREEGGTGLGLSVVKNLIDMHRGDIRIRNKAEGGVTAEVLLKLKRR